MKIDYKILKQLLEKCYSKELCWPPMQNQWTEDKKCLGTCAITALVINDFYGGEIAETYVGDISHFFNIIEDEIIDLTSEQFDCDVDYSNFEKRTRNEILENPNTQLRYNVLKDRLKHRLKETEKKEEQLEEYLR